jgi:hypothetical protein
MASNQKPRDEISDRKTAESEELIFLTHMTR